MKCPRVCQHFLCLAIFTTVTLSLAEHVNTQGHPSHARRQAITSEKLSQATLGLSTEDYGGDLDNIKASVVKLFLPEWQSAVLRSLRRLADEGTLDAAAWNLEGEMGGGERATQNMTSEVCLNHTIAFLTGLLARRSWALHMLDAMGKPGPGVTQGNLNWPGAYTLCRSVRANTSTPRHPHFSGQYCSAVLPLATPVGSPLPMQISLGVCIPDTCSALDMTLLVKSLLTRGNASNRTEPPSAYVKCIKPPTTLDARAIVGITICSFLLLLMLAGTGVDVLLVQWPRRRMAELSCVSTNAYTAVDDHVPLLVEPQVAIKPAELGTWTRVLLAFSVYTNGGRLVSTRQRAGSLGCVHGVRVLSMAWVVLGHCFAFPVLTSANAVPYIEKVMKRWTFQGILNASVSVDSFFVLSGLLVAYLSLKEMNKKEGKINWFFFYFHRFWRLTPAYMLVIMVYVCIQPYWGEGPFWQDVQVDRDSCRKSWWTSLLYINNLVNSKDECLGQSWYLANDMQFYILSPLIFLPLYYSPVFGMVSAGVFLLVTSVVPAVVTMKHSLPPGLLPSQLRVNPADQGDFMDTYYIKPYCRMGPYVVGMLAGYLLYRTNCTLRIHRYVNLTLWAVATASALAVLYGLYDATNGHPLTLPVSALYNAVSRQVWAACVAWVVVACCTGNAGFVNTVLSWPALIPLSRLTYCIYLLHIMVIETYLLNRNTVFYLDDMHLVMFFLGILVVCYMAAAVASLAFEAPMMALEKVVFHGDTKETKQMRVNKAKPTDS